MKKLLALLLALIMVLSLAACGQEGGGTQEPDNTEDPGTSEPDEGGDEGGDTGLVNFRMGYFDTGSQDGTSTPLRNNLVAAIESLGATGVPVQPAESTSDAYLDALDTLLSQDVDAVALPWVSFMYAGSPANLPPLRKTKIWDCHVPKQYHPS